MPIALRLALRQWLARPLRPILCSVAIGAAVALILVVGACFDSLRFSLTTAIGQMLGVAEIHVRPAVKGTGARLPQALLLQLRSRPDVELAAGRMEANAGLAHSGDRRWFAVVGVDPQWDQVLRPKSYVAGRPLAANPAEIVIDASVSKYLNAKVGDPVEFTIDGQTTRTATLVGIVKRPAIELISKPTAYLPLEALANDLHVPPEFNVIDLKLRESAHVDDYDAYAKRLAKELGPSVHVAPGTNSKAKLAEQTRSIHLILILLSTISGICAALIIGTTLSVGVQERVRTFGQLRCIGTSRSQLAAFVFADALLMLALGQAFGVLLGFGLSSALVHFFPQFFLAYKITAASILIAIANGCGAALLGSLIPLWQVTRVTPMAAVTNTAQPPATRKVWLAAALGLACLTLQLSLWALMPTRESKFYSYAVCGIPMVFLGYMLLGPSCLILCERFGAALLGRLLFIRPSLLRHAWSRTPWRAGAMIAALMIGVTLFTAVRARGQSLSNSFVSPARLPDLLLFSVAQSFLPSAVFPNDDQRTDRLLQAHPEIAEISSLAAFPVKLKSNVFKIGDILANPSTTFVAVDPQTFPQMVELEYLPGQGDPLTSVHELQDGQHIFVTKEFFNLRGLGRGDKLTLLAADGKPVDFTISAVVTSTGMELVKNYFDMRTVFSENAISSVLGTVADARKFFKLKSTNIMLINLQPAAASADTVARLRESLQQDGFECVSSVELKTGLRDLIRRVVDALSVVALGGLCVASLGVANMVIASVHARRFEFGVLRAIGAGRWQLVRLVLAEVTLIGLVAGALGAAAGLHFAFMGTLVDRTLVGFPTHFLDPHWLARFWSMGLFILLACAITTLLAWLASLLPAIKGACAAQRTLLAGGRA